MVTFECQYLCKCMRISNGEMWYECDYSESHRNLICYAYRYGSKLKSIPVECPMYKVYHPDSGRATEGYSDE